MTGCRRESISCHGSTANRTAASSGYAGCSHRGRTETTASDGGHPAAAEAACTKTATVKATATTKSAAAVEAAASAKAAAVATTSASASRGNARRQRGNRGGHQ
jgi:hypothetical protein